MTASGQVSGIIGGYGSPDPCGGNSQSFAASESTDRLSEVPREKCQWPVCGGDMLPPSGTCETRDIKSGRKKRIIAGHVGDITSRAA